MGNCTNLQLAQMAELRNLRLNLKETELPLYIDR